VQVLFRCCVSRLGPHCVAAAAAAALSVQANHDETLRASQQLAAKQQELAEARKRQLEAMGGAAGALQHRAVLCSMLHHCAVCCNVVQCGAVPCKALQYCAVCCTAVHGVQGAQTQQECHALQMYSMLRTRGMMKHKQY
jgi:hypothetical protein